MIVYEAIPSGKILVFSTTSQVTMLMVPTSKVGILAHPHVEIYNMVFFLSDNTPRSCSSDATTTNSVATLRCSYSKKMFQ
jgi:hypothetical protein